MARNSSAEITVTGLVQGVGYRAFVTNNASLLGLKGYVMNTRDHDKVKVDVEGDKNSIDDLVEKLKKGPMISGVDEVKVHWKEYKGIFKDFSVRY